jgi:hypothetical protein
MKKEIKQILIKVRNGGMITPAIMEIVEEVEREKEKSFEEGLEEGIKDGYAIFQDWKKEWIKEMQTGRICFNCGKKKKGNLTSLCEKCLEESN